MSAAPFAAELTPPERLGDALAERGYAVLGPTGFAAFVASTTQELDALRASWNDLSPDTYLKDGGHYRRRRHASFIAGTDGAVAPAPHRAHWQPLEYNALHGGLERWFEPVAAEVVASDAWRQILAAVVALATQLRGPQRWFVETHQFRIDTEGGIGRPTPEGAHRDGVDLVAVVLVDRQGVKGGETRVFDAGGPAGIRFTMLEPWSCLVLDDARVIHESTPIQPLESYGWRDTLVVTVRGRGFQGPG